MEDNLIYQWYPEYHHHTALTEHYNKIPYHLIDIISPLQDYSIYNYQIDFQDAKTLVKSKNKLPIFCGGSGLYLESILLNYQISYL